MSGISAMVKGVGGAVEQATVNTTQASANRRCREQRATMVILP
jgi:hypothetical protein